MQLTFSLAACWCMTEHPCCRQGVDSRCTCAGVQLPGSSLAEQFPKDLAARAERVWRTSVNQAARSSKLQEDVSRVLWTLGVAHKNNELTSDGLFCVDIALEGENVRPLPLVPPIYLLAAPWSIACSFSVAAQTCGNFCTVISPSVQSCACAVALRLHTMHESPLFWRSGLMQMMCTGHHRGRRPQPLLGQLEAAARAHRGAQAHDRGPRLHRAQHPVL